jgi:hypothetical protein
MLSSSIAAEILASWISSSGALACTVCGGVGREESKTAFMVTTALLSAVPLASVGSLVYFLYRRATRDKG